MADILRQSQAPVSESAWQEMNEAATQIFKAELTARRILDFSGPHGWECSSVNLGRLELSKTKSQDGIHWGMRQVQPLLEVRVPFTLNQMELDSINRGVKDADLSALEDAARKVARFEERAVYYGFGRGKIQGLVEASSHKALKMPADATGYPKAVSEAIDLLAAESIEGPYALVLGAKELSNLNYSLGGGGFPIRRIMDDLLGGGVYSSRAVDGAILLSIRGGDLQMITGQDLSIGYCTHDRDTVELYFTESFATQIVEPAAVVNLKAKT